MNLFTLECNALVFSFLSFLSSEREGGGEQDPQLLGKLTEVHLIAGSGQSPPSRTTRYTFVFGTATMI